MTWHFGKLDGLWALPLCVHFSLNDEYHYICVRVLKWHVIGIKRLAVANCDNKTPPSRET
jgi:hypothetical protein